MNVRTCTLRDVLILEPRIFADERGLFYESYNARTMAEAAGIREAFVQDNHSRSVRNVLRGLHYQVQRAAQGKLVRATRGEIFDVAVDIRRSSPTFGRWCSATLTESNRHMLWVPPGYAHGFLVLSEHAEVQYKTTSFWQAEHERCIAWNDPDLNISWPLTSKPLLSPKDHAGAPFSRVEAFE